MEITLSLLPPFLLERLELFCDELRNDFDCRFRDSRERRLLEFRLATGQEAPESLVEASLKSYHWYEWDDLFEWNERLSEAQFLFLLASYRDRLAHASGHSLIPTLTERIHYLESESKASRLPDEPHWLDLIIYRWRASLWREECRALGEIIKKELHSEA